MDNPAASQRYYAMDALRSSMMLLGIVLHAALPYTTVHLRAQFKDPDTNVVFDVLVFFLHSFRMPLFFVAAGFFAGLLCERYGVRGMVRNRFLRIFVPFAVGWIVLVPLTRRAQYFAEAVASSDSVWAGFQVLPWSMTYHLWTVMYHLWFLIALLLLYPFGLLLWWRVSRIDELRRRKWAGMTRRVLSSPWRPAVLICVTCAFGAVEFVSTGTILGEGAFAVFFGMGWLLYAHADLLPTLRHHAWTYIAVGFALLPVAAWAARASTFASADNAVAPGAVAWVAYSAMSAFMAFGMLGAVLTYCSRPNPVTRYLSDASYWIYLVHYPLIAFIGGMLASTAVAPALKFAATVAATTPILLGSYHLCVRFTAIGIVLNGRKHVRDANGRAIPAT
jgi:glucan biosynthesis protein C